MRRSVRRFAAVVAVAVAVASVASAGQPARFEQGPPKEFRPLDLALRLDSGVAAKRDHETFDLAAGVTLASCPTGVWSGPATFTGLAGGTVEWQGRLWRCFPFGAGTATYPNGTRHTGTVNSYLRTTAARGLLLEITRRSLRSYRITDLEAESPMWGRGPSIRKMTEGIDEAPAVWLRKEFSASGKPLRSARAFVSGLGYYELYINGRKVNDHYLNNAPYDYDKAVP